MNCTTPTVTLEGGQVHKNEAVNPADVVSCKSGAYQVGATAYASIVFVLTNERQQRWIYSDTSTRDADYKTVGSTMDSNVVRSVVVSRTNANTNPFLLVAANPNRKTVVIKNTTNVAMQIKYENSSTPTISATSYTRVILTSTITTGNEIEVNYAGAISARFNTTPNANPIFTTETF